MLEVWAPVPGYEGIIEVSTTGRVRSVNRIVLRSTNAPYRVHGRIKSLWKRTDERLAVSVSVHGELCNLQVHHLVAAAFLGPRPVGLDVCHNNGICTDNRLENLRYDTRSANIRDAVEHGTHYMKGRKKSHCKRGHALVDDNIYVSRQGKRNCMECNRNRVREAKRLKSGYYQRHSSPLES